MKTSKLIKATCIAIMLPLAASAGTILLDFKPAGTDADTNWNTVRSSGNPVINLIDDAGAATGYTLNVTTGFTGANAVGYTEAIDWVTSNAAGDLVYTSNTTTASFTIGGLDQDTVYDFTVFAFRGTAVDIRTGLYTATGANVVSGVLDGSSVLADFLVLENISPSIAGTITFTMTVDESNNGSPTKFAYINALKIDYGTIPEPGTYAIFLSLASVCYAATRRRHIRR